MDAEVEIINLINRFKSEPLYLAQVAIWNNPAGFSANAQAIGLPGAAGSGPEDLLELVFQSKLDRDGQELLFKVPIDPDGVNGDTLTHVFDRRVDLLTESGTPPGDSTWSQLFPESVADINRTHADFMGEDVEEDPKTDKAKKPCGCQGKRNKEASIFRGLAAIAAIVLLIVIVKKW